MPDSFVSTPTTIHDIHGFVESLHKLCDKHGISHVWIDTREDVDEPMSCVNLITRAGFSRLPDGGRLHTMQLSLWYGSFSRNSPDMQNQPGLANPRVEL